MKRLFVFEPEPFPPAPQIINKSIADFCRHSLFSYKDHCSLTLFSPVKNRETRNILKVKCCLVSRTESKTLKCWAKSFSSQNVFLTFTPYHPLSLPMYTKLLKMDQSSKTRSLPHQLFLRCWYRAIYKETELNLQIDSMKN